LVQLSDGMTFAT